jgi:anti-anti-sigma factor
MHIHGSPAEVVVCLRGEATAAAARTIEFGLLRLAALRLPLVTFDLSGLHFISSLAMGVLVAFRRGLVRCGGRVRLHHVLCPEVREALERANLLELFGPFEAAESSAAAAPAPAQAAA